MPSDAPRLQQLLQCGVAKIFCDKCGIPSDIATIQEIETNNFSSSKKIENGAPTKKFVMLCNTCRDNPAPFYTL